MECPFCKLIEVGAAGIAYVYRREVLTLEPLNPVTPGHLLFMTASHVEHPMPAAVALAMDLAARHGQQRGEQFNLIVSSGSDATQTQPHIHVHYVPRRSNDKLHLPWTGQCKINEPRTCQPDTEK